MSEIVNLNRARKARDKQASVAAAAENRIIHGLTRAQHNLAQAERERLSRRLDQTKREDLAEKD